MSESANKKQQRQGHLAEVKDMCLREYSVFCNPF